MNYAENKNQNNPMSFTLGRECLKYLVKLYGIKEINIPYYLCEAVRHALVEEECKPIFYHIDNNFMPDKEFSEDEYILYPNYFGICGQNAQNLAQKYPKLIVDNAHAYYDKPTGFACFNAGHKFGYKYSYLWLKNSPLQNIDIIKNDKILRKNEFLKLHEKYSSQNLLNIDTESIIAPFVYPLLIKSADEADKIVRFLNQEGKTIYRYWNQLPKNFNEYKFYSRLVPIPIIN